MRSALGHFYATQQQLVERALVGEPEVVEVSQPLSVVRALAAVVPVMSSTPVAPRAVVKAARASARDAVVTPDARVTSNSSVAPVAAETSDSSGATVFGHDVASSDSLAAPVLATGGVTSDASGATVFGHHVASSDSLAAAAPVLAAGGVTWDSLAAPVLATGGVSSDSSGATAFGHHVASSDSLSAAPVLAAGGVTSDSSGATVFGHDLASSDSLAAPVLADGATSDSSDSLAPVLTAGAGVTSDSSAVVAEASAAAVALVAATDPSAARERVPPPSPTAMSARAPIAALELVRPAPRVEAPPRPPALAWLKPVLHESLGWFLGAFLILAGVLYLVGDSWRTMSSDMRALTVFGLIEAWPLAFFAWARFLGRREHTARAAAGLRRIGALIAPLGVLALGGALTGASASGLTGSVLAALALVATTAIAGWTSARVAADLELPARDTRLVAISLMLSTVGAGLAPVLPVGSGWAVLVPIALAWPLLEGRWSPSRVVLAALPIAFFSVRLAVVPIHLEAVLSAAVVGLAWLGLRAAVPPRHADPRPASLEAGGLVALAFAFLLSFAAAAPACVVVCLLGAVATAKVALAPRAVPSPRRQWWLSASWVMAFLAWQRLDQLVPDQVWRWWDQLKVALGYAAAPMPVSYGAVYQAVFIALSVVVSAVALGRGARWAHAWLRTSSVGAVLSGALALVSLQTDARPALVALPLLTVPLVVVALVTRRRDALAAGAVLAALCGVVALVEQPVGLAAAVVALVLAGLSRLSRTRRDAVHASRFFGAASLFVAALAAVASTLGHGPLAISAAVTAAVAASVAGSRLHRRIHALALFTWLAVLPHAAEPVVAAAASLGLMALLHRAKQGRWRAAAWPVVVSAGLVAPLWQLALLALGRAPFVPGGFTFVTTALALGLAGETVRGGRVPLRGTALVLGVLAVAPWGMGFFAGWSPALALAALGLFTAGASVHAGLRGRHWEGVLVAGLSVALAVVLAVESLGHVGGALTWLAALVVLASSVALSVSLTVPLAAVLLVVPHLASSPGLLGVAIGATLLALAHESSWIRRVMLHGEEHAWSPVITAFLALVGALAWHHDAGLTPWLAVAAVALPVAWARALTLDVVVTLAVPLLAAAAPHWAFAAPVLAVVLGRAAAVRKVSAFAAGTHVAMVIATAAATVAAFGPVAAGPWFLALLLMGGSLAMVRLAAAGVLALSPELSPVAVATFATLGLLGRHAPSVARQLVGLRRGGGSIARLSLAALAAAVGLAALRLLAGWALVPSLPVAAVVAGALVLVTGLVSGGSAQRWGRALFCAAALGLVVLPAPLALAAALAILGLLGGGPLVWAVGAGVLAASLERVVPLVPATWLGPLGLGVAAGAAALRLAPVASLVERTWRRLGRGTSALLPTVLFASASVLAACSVLTASLSVWPVVTLAVLLLTPRRGEQAITLSLIGAAVVLHLDPVMLTLFSSGAALVLAVASRFGLRVAQVWRAAAVAFGVLGVGAAGLDVGAWTFPLAWVAAALVTWLIADLGTRWQQVTAWVMTTVAVHLVLGFVGTRLSHGDPKVLIFPWWAASSAVLAAVRALRGGRRSVLVYGALSVAEVLAGVTLLSSAWPREAVVCVLAALGVAWLAWREVSSRDSAAGAWLLQVALVAGGLAFRVLGQGAMPALTEAWVLLGASALFAGLSRFVSREERTRSGRALAAGAWVWALAGATLVPWADWSSASAWLAGSSVAFAWLSRTTARRSGALASAMAVNAALVVFAVGSGFGEPHLLLVPFGLTLMVLGWLFRGDLGTTALAHVRGWGMGFVYAAMAWKPLTVTTPGALLLCVVVCLAGVALGIAWRVRSYVWLGTGVLVTTVVATLVRSGLEEPRLGAVFLSLLGLGVVALMVVVSTRREELRERMATLQRVMATWAP
ncbi:MAG: hypothetical protein U0228_21560 [Myxococcaceae bacterium]